MQVGIQWGTELQTIKKQINKQSKTNKNLNFSDFFSQTQTDSWDRNSCDYRRKVSTSHRKTPISDWEEEMWFQRLFFQDLKWENWNLFSCTLRHWLQVSFFIIFWGHWTLNCNFVIFFSWWPGFNTLFCTEWFKVNSYTVHIMEVLNIDNRWRLKKPMTCIYFYIICQDKLVREAHTTYSGNSSRMTIYFEIPNRKHTGENLADWTPFAWTNGLSPAVLPFQLSCLLTLCAPR